MSMFEECADYLCEPYNQNLPLYKHLSDLGSTTDATVTIVSESTEDGISVTRVNTPPKTETSKLIDAINNILGIFGQLGKDEKESEKKSEKEGDNNGSYDSDDGESKQSDESDSEFHPRDGGSGQADSSERVETEDE